MKWRIIIAGCLALLVAFGLRWLLPGERAGGPAPPRPDTRFDYTLSDFEARFNAAGGHTELIVSGPRLEHVSETRVATIAEPRFRIEPEGADWRGRADHGRILRDDEVLTLEDDVELVQDHPDGEIRITADHLHHQRQARTITSHGPVTVYQNDSRLVAGGLIISLDDDIIELTDHVQGELFTIPGADRGDAAAGDGDG